MRHKVLWLMAGVLASLSACLEKPAAPPPACQITRIVDGDTLHLSCGGTVHRVRLLDYDSPEVFHPHCPAERRAGQQATTQLRAFAAGPVTGLRLQGQDRYGRDLAHVAVNGQDLSTAMLSTPYALPYQGHKHPDWCGLLTH